jgi:transposase
MADSGRPRRDRSGSYAIDPGAFRCHACSSVRGQAHVGHGGNARLRTVLYLASLSASRYNPHIQVFYTRLRERGKAVKVARCAAARKLLHLAWALVTKGQVFDPHYRLAAQDELVVG